MIMKHTGVILILFSMLFFSAPSLAKSSAIQAQKAQLESAIQKKYEPKQMAKFLSDFDADTSEYEDSLRLYVASKWFDQKFVSASAKLLQSLSSSKEYTDLYLYLKAVTALNLKKSSQAEVLLEKLLTRNPDDPEALFLKSVYLADVGHLKPAIQTLTNLLKKDRRNGEYYLQRGVYRLVALNNDDALEDLKKAAKYLPKDDVSKRQQALLQVGVIYFKHKFNKTKGQKYIQKGIDLDPNSELVRQLQKTLRF